MRVSVSCAAVALGYKKYLYGLRRPSISAVLLASRSTDRVHNDPWIKVFRNF